MGDHYPKKGTLILSGLIYPLSAHCNIDNLEIQ